ncbi:TonB family protein [Alteromonadaceae bacterium M269]|nr:TonB family protein [Alteromonadaceae bacterium M269]
MTSWLIEQTLLVTLIVSLLLLLGGWLSRKIGTSNHYMLWFIVPVSLIINSLDLSLLVNRSPVTTFLVTTKSQASQLAYTGLGIEDWLSLIWGVGFCLMASYILAVHIQSLKSMSKQIKVADEIPTFDYKTIDPKLTVRFVDQSISPFLSGVLFPKLIVPADFQQMFSKEQQKLILAHESVHFRRKDILWNHLALALLTLFWFNPICWLAYRKFRLLQELSCDQTVMAGSNKETRLVYAKALLNASSRHPVFNLSQLTFGEKSMLKERLNQLKTHQGSSLVGKFITAVGIVAVGSMLTIANADLPKTSEDVKPIVRINPVYPSEAIEKKLEGFVKLAFDVNSNGLVSNIKVMESSPKGVFDDSARVALSRWKYANHTGETVNSAVQLDFLLEQDPIEKVSIIAND